MKDLFSSLLFFIFIFIAFITGVFTAYYDKYATEAYAKRIVKSVIDGFTSAFITMLVSMGLILYLKVEMTFAIVIGGFIGHLGYKMFIYLVIIIGNKLGFTKSELLLDLVKKEGEKNETDSNTKS